MAESAAGEGEGKAKKQGTKRSAMVEREGHGRGGGGGTRRYKVRFLSCREAAWGMLSGATNRAGSARGQEKTAGQAARRGGPPHAREGRSMLARNMRYLRNAGAKEDRRRPMTGALLDRAPLGAT